MVTQQTAEEVVSTVQGKNGVGRMEALRSVSDLLHGHITPQEFNDILETVRGSQTLPGLSEKRQAFNEAYLETIDALVGTFQNLNS